MKKGSSHFFGRKENKNYNWRGDDITYSNLHYWIRKHLPKPKYCEMCKTNPPTQVANFNGKYLRDLIYWWWLCLKCHREYDKNRKLRAI